MLLETINTANGSITSNKNVLPNIQHNQKIIITPNPCTESIKLVASCIGYNFQIIDLMGKIKLKGNVDKNFVIDVSELKAGIYQVILSSGTGNVLAEKFVKAD